MYLINRKQKRYLDKYKSNNIKAFNYVDKHNQAIPQIGDKCKLNVKRITNRKDWLRFNPKYKQFVLDNVDTVFTVQKDNFESNEDGVFVIVTLNEDVTEPRWLWSVDDLIKIE